MKEYLFKIIEKEIINKIYEINDVKELDEIIKKAYEDAIINKRYDKIDDILKEIDTCSDDDLESELCEELSDLVKDDFELKLKIINDTLSSDDLYVDELIKLKGEIETFINKQYGLSLPDDCYPLNNLEEGKIYLSVLGELSFYYLQEEDHEEAYKYFKEVFYNTMSETEENIIPLLYLAAKFNDNIIINDLKNHLVARPSIVHFVIAFSELIEDRDLGKFLKSVFKIYPAFTFYLSNYYLFLKPSFSTYFLGLLDIEKKENKSKSSRIQFLMAHSLYRVFDDDFEEIMEECSKYKDLYNPAFCLDKNSKTFIEGTIEYLETQGNILVSKQKLINFFKGKSKDKRLRNCAHFGVFKNKKVDYEKILDELTKYGVHFKCNGKHFFALSWELISGEENVTNGVS